MDIHRFAGAVRGVQAIAYYMDTYKHGNWHRNRTGLSVVCQES